ncbi:hypothetical protein AXG93_3037s1050 [Marchantia polymorpha subsp. ruderalis]|uniref:RING-type E3 ubiquitin transferase n=1 Tax=Marchantia polymorpha subsp. ruderalis TaxID=1480154 RepID=A0A176WNL7_MARPO|nr:hypothetical protein AXG93_3037s1050 [Marchantia polymorpha subsp. ruderalis]
MSSDQGSVGRQPEGSETTASSQQGVSKEDEDDSAAEVGGSFVTLSGEPHPEAPADSSEGAALLSPGFRSVAAMAGWDDEALMMAALNQSPAVATGPQNVDECEPPCAVPDSPVCRDRKRDKRTPLSSARRHRRVRWHGNNGSPLVRVPMKALPLLSDSDKGSNNVEEENCHCSSSAKRDKENMVPGTSMGRKNSESKGKLKEKTPMKEKTPTKPPYMDQLREELSCAVCLDICFEPSTISCGHRSETLRSCRINTVLWNTIQILFPQECAARQTDKQTQQDQEEEAGLVAKNGNGSLGVRPSRLQPWRSSSSAFSSTVNRISVMGTLRSSFQAAAQFIGDDREIGSTRRGDDEVRHVSTSSGPVSQQEIASQRSQSRSGRIRRARQEQVDAALAARLQQAELMMGSRVEEAPLEEPRQAAYTRSWNHNRPRYGGTVALAAANLRTVASRATRHRTRPQS